MQTIQDLTGTIVKLKSEIVEKDNIILELRGYDEKTSPIVTTTTSSTLQVSVLTQKETEDPPYLTEKILLEQNAIRRVIDKHMATVDEWLADNKTIQDMCESEDIVFYSLTVSQVNMVDDDDVKSAIIASKKDNNACVLLLEQHSICHELIYDQYERLKCVSNNMREVFGQKRAIIVRTSLSIFLYFRKYLYTVLLLIDCILLYM